MIFNKLIEESKKAYFLTENPSSDDINPTENSSDVDEDAKKIMYVVKNTLTDIFKTEEFGGGAADEVVDRVVNSMMKDALDNGVVDEAGNTISLEDMVNRLQKKNTNKFKNTTIGGEDNPNYTAIYDRLSKRKDSVSDRYKQIVSAIVTHLLDKGVKNDSGKVTSFSHVVDELLSRDAIEGDVEVVDRADRNTFTPKSARRDAYHKKGMNDGSGVAAASEKWDLDEIANSVLGSDEQFVSELHNLVQSNPLDSMTDAEGAALYSTKTDDKNEEKKDVVEAKWRENYKKLVAMYDKFKSYAEDAVDRIAKEFEGMNSDTKNLEGGVELSDDAKRALEDPDYLDSLNPMAAAMIQGELDNHNQFENQFDDMSNSEIIAKYGDKGADMFKAVQKMQLPIEDRRNPLHSMFSKTTDEVIDEFDNYKSNLWLYSDDAQRTEPAKVLTKFNEGNFVRRMINKIIDGGMKSQEDINKVKTSARNNRFADMASNQLDVDGATSTDTVDDSNIAMRDQFVGELESMLGVEMRIDDLMKMFTPYKKYYGKNMNKIKGQVFQHLISTNKDKNLRKDAFTISEEDLDAIKNIALLDTDHPFLSGVTVEDEETFDNIAESVLASIDSIDMDDLELDIREVFESIKKTKKYTKK